MSNVATISAILLGLSLTVSLVKLVDWWISTDPRSMIQTGRWLAVLAAAASLVGLGLLIANRQWTAAMVLAAAMVPAAVFLDWRAINPLPRRFRPLWSRVATPPAMSEPGGPGHPRDPELIVRAAALLEGYRAGLQAAYADPRLERPRSEDGASRDGGGWTSGAMSEEEALAVLGLTAAASVMDIRRAHRRLVQMIHPDRGGSEYLTAKLNQAKETLLSARSDDSLSA